MDLRQQTSAVNEPAEASLGAFAAGAAPSAFANDVGRPCANRDFMFVVASLVMRDFRVRYRNMSLGTLWSLAVPLIIMRVLTIVFKNVFPNFSVKNHPSAVIFGVSKSFSRSGRQMLRRSLLTELRERQTGQRLIALKDLSFELHEGDSVAIVGRNGAGKSTLLSLIAGLSWPDSGTIRVDDRLAALLDLGAGFHRDLTGHENLFINSVLLGLNRREGYERHDRIGEFSALGEFVNQPLRTYWSGMIMRLAFSVAAHVGREIILIDEVRAVGGANFQEKCTQEIERLKQSGSLFFCVSQGSAMLRPLCEKAIWLEHGSLVQKGDIDEVPGAYDSHRQEFGKL